MIAIISIPIFAVLRCFHTSEELSSLFLIPRLAHALGITWPNVTNRSSLFRVATAERVFSARLEKFLVKRQDGRESLMACMAVGTALFVPREYSCWSKNLGTRSSLMTFRLIETLISKRRLKKGEKKLIAPCTAFRRHFVLIFFNTPKKTSGFF